MIRRGPPGTTKSRAGIVQYRVRQSRRPGPSGVARPRRRRSPGYRRARDPEHHRDRDELRRQTISLVTNASGLWTTDDGSVPLGWLAAGDYTIAVDTADPDLPSGVVNTADPDGGLDSTALKALGENEVDTTQDFGYAGTGSVGDFVWLDLDADGVQDAGEPGIPDADVLVTWSGFDRILGTADDIDLPVTTNADGLYTAPGFTDAYDEARRRIDQIDRLVLALDEQRETMGITKAELARRADLAPEAIRRLFSADGPNPTIGTLTAIADALELELVPRKRRVR